MAASARPAAIEIRPQPGPQEAFLATSADIAIFGGARGGAKTFSLVLEPLRHAGVDGFGAVIFRRTSPQIKQEGGLWDTAQKIYPHMAARAKETTLEWAFPSGARVRFAHLETEADKQNWMGAQIALLGFDELTHFTKTQFWFLLSSNRSTCGVRPYVRATCNPDADSWVAEFIAWWIDRETGYPIEERAGVLRWFLRVGDALHWFDSRNDALAARAGLGLSDETEPTSLTFIPARLEDNPALTSADPQYRSRLEALPLVDRERFLKGNWKIRATAGMYFRREYFEIVDAAPADARSVRAWDLAASEAKSGTDPDWTVGARLALKDGIVYIADIRRLRGRPLEVQRLARQTADLDGRGVPIRIEQEPGASGVDTIDHYQREVLAGFDVRGKRASGDKVLRAGPLSAQAEAGNVKLVRGAWNEAFLVEAENFPPQGDGGHDDQIDACAAAYQALTSAPSWRPV